MQSNWGDLLNSRGIRVSKMLQLSRYYNMRVTSLFFSRLRLDHTWHQKAVSVLLLTGLPIISDFWIFCVCFSAQYDYIPYQSTVFFAKMPIFYPFEPPSVARLRPSDDPPPSPHGVSAFPAGYPLVQGKNPRSIWCP